MTICPENVCYICTYILVNLSYLAKVCRRTRERAAACIWNPKGKEWRQASRTRRGSENEANLPLGCFQLHLRLSAFLHSVSSFSRAPVSDYTAMSGAPVRRKERCTCRDARDPRSPGAGAWNQRITKYTYNAALCFTGPRFPRNVELVERARSRKVIRYVRKFREGNYSVKLAFKERDVRGFFFITRYRTWIADWHCWWVFKYTSRHSLLFAYIRNVSLHI